MDVFHAILLGTVQGLTEFLPISSSGHLVIIGALIERDLEAAGSTAQTVLLHLGSLLAILYVFRADILRLFRPRMAWNSLGLLAVASVPAVIAGVVIKLLLPDSSAGWVELNVLNSPLVAAFGLLATAALLWMAERPREARVEFEGARGIDFWLVTLIGLAQMCAILPGVSRSGSTICVALMLGWVRNDAVKLSFLMGLIAIGGAGLVEARNISQIEAGPAIAGFIASLVFSLLGLWGIKLVVARSKLRWFAVYCLFAGCGTLCWLALA